jgi:hypothetical protein
MAVINKHKTTYTTENTSTLVPDFTIQTTFGRSISDTVVNTGDKSLTLAVHDGNESDLSDAVEIKTDADVLDGAIGSYSSDVAVFESYGLYLNSTVADTPTTCFLNAIVKN